jgi:hypothetical protein
MQADWRVAGGDLLRRHRAHLHRDQCAVDPETDGSARRYLHDPVAGSDQQFLWSNRGGKEVTVAGEFRVAQGIGKLPVVVLMHGSSGVSSTTEAWTHQFNAMGISTFVIDGFSGRGLTVVGPNQALLGRRN